MEPLQSTMDPCSLATLHSSTLAERLVQVQRDLALAWTATNDTQAALSLLLDYTLAIEGLDCGGVYLADGAGGGLRLAVHRGLSDAFVNAVGSFTADSPQAQLIRAGCPVYFAGPDIADRDPASRPEGIRAIAAVPIRYGGDVIACVNLASRTRDEIPLVARQWIEGITLQLGGAIARIQAREALAWRTCELESLANNVPDIIFRLDDQLRYVFINQRMAEATGRPPADFMGRPCASLGLSRDWSAACAGACRELLAAQSPAQVEFDTEVLERDRCYQTRLVPEVGPRGRLVSILGSTRDITEQRRREDELRITATHYRQLVENCPDAIFVHDGERFLFADSQTARLVGAPSAPALIGTDVWACIPLYFQSVSRRRAEYLLRTPGATVPPLEQEVVRQDGTTVPVEVSASSCLFEGRRAVQVIIRDIRPRRAAEAEVWQRRQDMAQAARVTLLGEMASGLAHELNQPLSAILNYAEAGRQRLLAHDGLPSAVAEDLESITRQAERAGNIIRGLRRLMGRDSPLPETLCLSELLREAVDLAKWEAERHGIRITFDLAAPSPSVRVDRVQIQQVVLNLVQNSIEALATVEVPQREITIRGHAAGAGVEVAIEDNGPGIVPAVSDRFLEPFVTTKPQGLGLGLVICQSIVEAHQGRLWYVPARGGGAGFHFSLPAGEGMESDGR